MFSVVPQSDLLEVLPGSEGAIRYVSLEKAERSSLGSFSRLPMTLKILAECALRKTADLANLNLHRLLERPRGGTFEFHPARLLLQDFTGIPLMTDLASLRDALTERGLDPALVNPKLPIDFVVDHALVAVYGGGADAMARNEAHEIAQNRERFEFLKWCSTAFANVRLIPPGSGIMHQLNLEWLSCVVRIERTNSGALAFPDTLLGTDSHTPMVGGLGVLGWGVGGLEAEAAMLGQGTLVKAPRVVGLHLSGRLKPLVSATDLVLHVTEALRKFGVIGAFVEVFGEAVPTMPVETRATLANMAPEYGATSVYFPIDRETLRYLQLTGRNAPFISRVEAYAKAQGLWGEEHNSAKTESYDALVELDLSAVEPCLAGPSRPEQRVKLTDVPASFVNFLTTVEAPTGTTSASSKTLADGDVVIAAVTSCANTANPSLMLAAGLFARNAVRRGLRVKPWVKSSLAPGSRVVSAYLRSAGLQDSLDALGFQIVGFGCTTCNGNSGPLSVEISEQIAERNITAVAVLSGNRNFAGRIHPLVRASYLASPALVIAYAIAGSVLSDLTRTPLGVDAQGRAVMLSDIWPSDREVAELASNVSVDLYRDAYHKDPPGHARWADIAAPVGALYPWRANSTFIGPSPMTTRAPGEQTPDMIVGIRPLVILGDSITTDHISPNGAILKGTPAAEFLTERGVSPTDFGSYAARRGNYEVALRGTFANSYLQNEMLPGQRGSATLLMPEEQLTSIYEAGMAYVANGTPTMIIAGRNYGSGSSRDWAAKGPAYLGVVAVLAESFERIHRSNLVGMGILPLTFSSGVSRKTLALNGREQFRLNNMQHGITVGGQLSLDILRNDYASETIVVNLRLETESEVRVLRAGGLLPVLLDQLTAPPTHCTLV